MGGLTVRAAIARALPNESLVYFGDGKNVPYGPRPREEIIRFVDEAIAKLINDHNIKLLVVACNAATGAAIDHLRAKYTTLPIIGMEPAVKPAALTTKTGTIGVLATAAAFRSVLYNATANKYRETTKILEAVGDGFVELVENDEEDTEKALEIVRAKLEPMLAAGADRIVLGCTHYPYLAPKIRRVIEEHAAKTHTAETPVESARIVDSAPAIARRAEQLLTENSLQADQQNTPQHKFLTFAGTEYLDHLARKSEKVPPM
jgi:glutamate racemase